MVYKAEPMTLPGQRTWDLAPVLIAAPSLSGAAEAVQYPAGVTFRLFAVGAGMRVHTYDVTYGPDPEIAQAGIYRKEPAPPGRIGGRPGTSKIL